MFQRIPRIPITSNSTTFNGRTMKRNRKGVFSPSQEDKINKLSKTSTHKDFSSSRKLSQYVGGCVLPTICALVQVIAPGNIILSTEAEIKVLHKSIDFLLKYISWGSILLL